jgi:ribonuclease E
MKDNTAAVHCQVPVEVASFLLNEKRTEIAKIELKQRVSVVLIPNKSLETPHYKLERLKHDDPRLDSLDASYKLADVEEEQTQVTRRSQEPTNKQTPVIKGVLPDAPAPVAEPRPEGAARPARNQGAQGNAQRPAAPAVQPQQRPAPAPAPEQGFFSWLKSLFGFGPAPAPAPVAVAPQQPAEAARGEARRDGRSGERGRRGGRDGNREGNGEGRGRRGEGRSGERALEGREGRDSRNGRNGERAESEGRREPREPREGRGGRERGERQSPAQAALPQGAETQAPLTAPADEGTPEQARAERAPRGERGERGGRRERGERRERGPRTIDANAPAPAAAAPAAPGADFVDTAPLASLPDLDLSAGETAPAAAESPAGGEERRERRSRDRYGRDRRERGPRGGDAADAQPAAPLLDFDASAIAAPAAGDEEAAQEPARRSYFAASAAPAPAAEAAPASAAPVSPAPVAPAPVEAPAPAPAPAPVAVAVVPEGGGMPRVQSFALPVDALIEVAKSSGLEWINSDAEKIASAQAAIAAEPQPIRVPRERPPVVVVDEGPLVLVETRRDLRDLQLPFEQEGRA